MLTKPTSRIKAFTTLFFLGLILAVWISLSLPLITEEQGYKYTVQPGASMNSVISDLTERNIIKHPFLFKLLVKIKRNSHELKFGNYFFPKGTSSLKLLNQITTGKGMVHHAFTIIPGWNFYDVRQALLENPYIVHTIQSETDETIMAQLGEPNVKPEGQFFPDTFYFVDGSTDISVLKRAHKTMQEKLKIAWDHRESGLLYKSPYEALIVASLVEKEAHVNLDRPLIAGVIINRLKKDMLLQIDPTVIYGLGKRYTGNIRKTDLAEDTPYNTYIRKGLPPTPIAMPGPESIQAAMHPMKHEFYYFVVKGLGDSSHQFSKTLDEHYQAVAESRKFRFPFFNEDLIRQYFLKMVSQN